MAEKTQDAPLTKDTPIKPGPESAPTGETPTPRAVREDGQLQSANDQPKEPVNIPAGKRLETVPYGIAGATLTTVERLMPADEPSVLPVNEELKVIGKPTRRQDGRMKVTGAARYTADINLPGMLFARMISSPHPHARVLSVDTSAAERHPGVVAVHVLERVLGSAQLRDPSKEQPSKYPMIRYAGQPIAAVAATSQAIADEAARLVKVEYQVLPFVTDVGLARNENVPLVFPGAADMGETAGGGGGGAGASQTGNVRGPMKGGRGDVTKGFADAEVIVEGEYHTQVQTHSPLETHGVVADYRPDGLTVWASTQGTSTVRDEMAEILGLPKSQVRCICEFMGGGFGAKFGAGNWGLLAAQLSKKAQRPVRLMLDRKEQHLCTGNRPDSHQTIKIGAKKDGTLTAIELVNYGTAGVGTGAGASGPAQSAYPCPNVKTEDYDVFVHAGPAAAFRAPGHPQGAFALEQAIDELAEKLGIDPVEYRDRIETTGERAEAHRVQRRIGAERIGWANRKPAGADEGPIKRGLGIAQSIWYRWASRDSACDVKITKDGSVELMSAVQDIGGGVKTVLAQCVAEELGLKPQDIRISIGDTRFPIGPSSGGSVTTNSISPAARNAAFRVKQMLLSEVAPKMGVAADDLVMSDGKVISRSDPSKSMSFRDACGKLPNAEIAARATRSEEYAAARRETRGGGALAGVQFVQVAVDTGTGIVKVERVVAVHDCGRPINPLGVESQINGGVIQGISYALYEDRLLDHSMGVMVNPNLEQYKIVGAKETPVIEPVLIEEYWGRSSTDAAGIGEPATVPTAAAVANAVYNAIGVRVRRIPMTPAVVLAALNDAGADTARSAQR